MHPMHQRQFSQLVFAKDGIPLDNPYWADTINVAPGDRYSVLLHPDDPGTWVWHCHILTHVENDEGMFGMVTALVVQPAGHRGPGVAVWLSYPGQAVLSWWELRHHPARARRHHLAFDGPAGHSPLWTTSSL